MNKGSGFPIHKERCFPISASSLWAVPFLAGVTFRLFYPGVIEFHGDEQFSFNHVRAVLDGGPWPSLGMTMSIGGPNPGMSVWIFIVLGLITQPETPVQLAQSVQLLNILALGGFFLLAARVVSEKEREGWLWAGALWAVNPLAIVYERKIWPPSTLPIFVVAMLFAWWHRRSVWGSFVFSLVAVLGGQIHPTALFLGAAIFLWTVIGEWPKQPWRSFNLPALIAGGLVGILPAVNWFTAYYGAGNSLHAVRWPSLAFYFRWVSEPFGFGADHALGPIPFRDFLAWPYWESGSTWLVLALHVALIALAAATLALATNRALRGRHLSVRRLLIGESAGGRLVRAAFFGFGTILTVLTIVGGGLYPHYLIVIAPLMTLWVARLVTFADGGILHRRGRLILTAVCLADGLLVLLLFSYIHAIGDIRGEFGPSWEWQSEQLAP